MKDGKFAFSINKSPYLFLHKSIILSYIVRNSYWYVIHAWDCCPNSLSDFKGRQVLRIGKDGQGDMWAYGEVYSVKNVTVVAKGKWNEVSTL